MNLYTGDSSLDEVTLSFVYIFRVGKSKLPMSSCLLLFPLMLLLLLVMRYVFEASGTTLNGPTASTVT